jgi:hypothetical protein
MSGHAGSNTLLRDGEDAVSKEDGVEEVIDAAAVDVQSTTQPEH